ncbi:MAG: MFS transporter [Saprospiraceae bacterium]|nr:MFS transporter [Bacteroidia bacterium]NNL90962.1 MFS transporter [Saprospiraceae bacterium]
MLGDQINAKRLYTPIFILLCLSQVLFSASFNMIIPELPDYLRSIGGEDYIGMIIALFTLTAGLSRPFSGKLTDTIGRMPVQIIGTLVCVFASLLYPFASSVFVFLLLRLFHGFSTGFKPTGTSAYLADIVPINRRGEAMGILGISMNLGASVSPPFGSYIANNFGLDAMFYTSSGIALISVIILLNMKETLDNKQKFKLELLKLNRTEIIDKSAIPPSILAFFVYGGIGVLLTICPDQCDYYGLSNKGIFFTSFTVMSILSRLVAGKASDKYGRTKVLIWSIFFLIISLVSFHFVNSGASLLIATGGLGFAMGLSSPAVFAWAIDRCEDQNRGKALATVFIALEISIGLGAVMAGWIYDSNPLNFGKVFLILAAITCVGLIYLIWFRRNERT